MTPTNGDTMTPEEARDLHNLQNPDQDADQDYENRVDIQIQMLLIHWNDTEQHQHEGQRRAELWSKQCAIAHGGPPLTPQEENEVKHLYQLVIDEAERLVQNDEDHGTPTNRSPTKRSAWCKTMKTAAAPTTMSKIKDRLDVLEAQRLVLTIELRNALLVAACKLLPQAIRQAKPSGRGKHRRAGSPALLRLITRLAMRPVQIDKPRK